jgi:hypothetical protein
MLEEHRCRDGEVDFENDDDQHKEASYKYESEEQRRWRELMEKYY